MDEIERLFVTGDLKSAQCMAEDAIAASTASDLLPYTWWLAKIELYEGNSLQAATLLQSAQPWALNKALSIRRDLVLAIAEDRLSRTRYADQSIQHAYELRPEGTLLDELQAAEGTIALNRGLLKLAEGSFAFALSGAETRNDLYLQTEMWMNLGVVALRREHYEDALHRLTSAALIAGKINAKLALQKSQGNLGWVYYQTGDYKRALESSQRAAVAASDAGAVLDQIQWFKNCGMSDAEMGDRAGARSFFIKSLSLAELLGDSETKLSAHVALANLFIQDDPLSASKHVEEAKKLVEQRGFMDEKSEVRLLESLLLSRNGRANEAKSVLVFLASQSVASPWVLWRAEYALAIIYQEQLKLRLAETSFNRAIFLYRLQRTMLRSVELQLPFLENGSDLYMGYMEHLIRAGRTGEALRLLDTSRAETLAEGLGTAPAQTGKAADPRAVAGRLRATILVYCLRPERSYLWAITGKRQAFYTLRGSGAILPLVARHNEAILGSKDLTTHKDSTGRALYDALVAPAAALLPQDGGRVMLVADSALSRLNFETLIAPGESTGGKAAHYWIEDVRVTNARSLRLLAAGGEARRRENAVVDASKMLLIGDPVYEKGEYAPLPNAASEMAGIAGHFSTAERVVAARQEALPAVYEASRPGRFRFLHFVAHATASELNPLDSAVILSNKDAGKDTAAAGGSNKLYASEILKQPLSAELVTLSSCYSSGTRNYTGEGVVGLAWAFLRAGAHSVIGALWEVSDVSTPKLMDTMYTRLLAGDAPDAALRAAKLEMLHSEGVFRKPVYWGAFQLYAGR